MRRSFLLSLLVFLSAACAPRGALLPPVHDLPAGAKVQQVFVASNRAPLFENAVQFSADRREGLRFARLDISIPPVHRKGRIEWPGRTAPDPGQHFMLNNAWRYPGEDAFAGALDAAGGAQNEVIVFVHGYNVNYAEAAFRLAQIAHDFDADLPVVSFSWPSFGEPDDYVYDRDSVIFSRDALERLLLRLMRGDRKVLLVAHSMGSQLVMESLRQMSIGGRGAVLQSLSGVVLISPDIDPEVFVRQARRIKPFPKPFLLAVSARDRVLGLSAWLSQSPRRLGSITSKDALDGVPVEIVDLTPFSEVRAGGHDTAFSAPPRLVFCGA